MLFSLSCALGIIIVIAALRWQPWITRLQLPGFLLAAPIVAIALSELSGILTLVVAMLSIIFAIPCILLNVERPLSGVGGVSVFATDRVTRMFITQVPAYRESVNALVDTIALSKVKKVGLVLGGDDWEYPYWALLRARTKMMPEIRSVCFELLAHSMREETGDNWQADAILMQVDNYVRLTNEAGFYRPNDVMTCDKISYKQVMSREFAAGDKNVSLNLYVKVQ